MSRLTVTPAPLKSLRPDLPDEAEALIARMMALEPGRRHPTYASLIGDLKRIQDVMGGEIDVSEYTAKRFGASPTQTGRNRRVVTRASLRNTTSARPPSPTRETATETAGTVVPRGMSLKLKLGLAAAVLFLFVVIIVSAVAISKHGA